MMTDDEILEVVKAHKDGKKLQYSDSVSKWVDVEEFTFLWDFCRFNYRVSPEPRKPREWTLYFYNGVLTHICPTTLNYETIRVREVIKEDKKSTVQIMMEHATGFKND